MLYYTNMGSSLCLYERAEGAKKNKKEKRENGIIGSVEFRLIFL